MATEAFTLEDELIALRRQAASLEKNQATLQRRAKSDGDFIGTRTLKLTSIPA